VEDLTFLAEDETGDGIPLSVHSVSIVSLVSCGDSEVGYVRLLRFLGQRVRGILYHGIHHQRLPYQNAPKVR